MHLATSITSLVGCDELTKRKNIVCSTPNSAVTLTKSTELDSALASCSSHSPLVMPLGRRSVADWDFSGRPTLCPRQRFVVVEISGAGVRYWIRHACPIVPAVDDEEWQSTQFRLDSAFPIPKGLKVTNLRRISPCAQCTTSTFTNENAMPASAGLQGLAYSHSHAEHRATSTPLRQILSLGVSKTCKHEVGSLSSS